MGSKDRIVRHKENTRHNILQAALHIGKENGWQNLSMRKIADAIEYSSPVIYEYFNSKDDLLRELARQGFVLLTTQLIEAKKTTTDSNQQLKRMMIAYWNFAFAERQLYQIMFGIEFTCSDFKHALPEAQMSASLFAAVISDLLNVADGGCEQVQKYYYTFWSMLHGLIAINLTRQDMPENINALVLEETIITMMDMLTNAASNNQ